MAELDRRTTSHGDDPGALLDLATSIALEAGELLVAASRSHSARSALARGAVRKTSRTDLATEADHHSEQLIGDRLLLARPDDGLLAEEGAARPSTSGLTWIVDPLDGTTNFVYDFAPWSVSIAVADRSGETLAGVVHDPTHGETFRAARGAGATLNGVALHVAEPPPLSEALIGTGFGYTAERRRDQAVVLGEVLPAIRDLRRAGSAALDLCSVAAGRLDGYYEAGLQPWDRAAGLLVAQEAGASALEPMGVVDGIATLVVARSPLCGVISDLLERSARRARGGHLRG